MVRDSYFVTSSKKEGISFQMTDPPPIKLGLLPVPTQGPSTLYPIPFPETRPF